MCKKVPYISNPANPFKGPSAHCELDHRDAGSLRKRFCVIWIQNWFQSLTCSKIRKVSERVNFSVSHTYISLEWPVQVN